MMEFNDFYTIANTETKTGRAVLHQEKLRVMLMTIYVNFMKARKTKNQQKL